MHRDHKNFVKAIQFKKKVKLTFYHKEQGDVREGLFGPIFYSGTITGGEDSDCYYLWNFESENGKNFVCLPPSQIVSMELSEQSFDFVEFFTSRKVISDTKGEDDLSLPKPKTEESGGASL